MRFPYGLVALAFAAVALTACSPPREPVPVTPAAEKAGAPVVRSEAPVEPTPLASAPPAGSIVPSRPLPEPPVVLPDGAIYVCVADKDGQRSQTVIEFVPKVHALCKRHPEMGPCQYERDICRRAGGRVYAAGGQEVTLATEAEYDKKVMRVRFRSN